jgi:hypothetical protein
VAPRARVESQKPVALPAFRDTRGSARAQSPAAVRGHPRPARPPLNSFGVGLQRPLERREVGAETAALPSESARRSASHPRSRVGPHRLRNELGWPTVSPERETVTGGRRPACLGTPGAPTLTARAVRAACSEGRQVRRRAPRALVVLPCGAASGAGLGAVDPASVAGSRTQAGAVVPLVRGTKPRVSATQRGSQLRNVSTPP